MNYGTATWVICIFFASQFEGSLLVASAVHVILGASGLVGYVSHFIGPLTVAPTIALIGVVIIDSAIDLSSTHWGISILWVTIPKWILSFKSYSVQYNVEMMKTYFWSFK